jgi:hypothetical protein
MWVSEIDPTNGKVQQKEPMRKQQLRCCLSFYQSDGQSIPSLYFCHDNDDIDEKSRYYTLHGEEIERFLCIKYL